MKKYSKFYLVIILFSIASIAKANERCGKNILHSAVDLVCFDYSAWALRVTDRNSGGAASFSISPYSPRTYTGGTLRVLEYEFKNKERGFYREVYRDVDPPNFTSTKKWLLDYIEGVTPNGEFFKYLVF